MQTAIPSITLLTRKKLGASKTYLPFFSSNSLYSTKYFLFISLLWRSLNLHLTVFMKTAGIVTKINKKKTHMIDIALSPALSMLNIFILISKQMKIIMKLSFIRVIKEPQ